MRRMCEKQGQERLSPKSCQGDRAQVQFICSMLDSWFLWRLLCTYLLNLAMALAHSQGCRHDGAEADWCSKLMKLKSKV